MREEDLVGTAELLEACALETMYAAARAEVREALGLTHARVAGGFVGVAASDPSRGCWSRAVGLGVGEPVTDAVVGEVLDLVRDAGGSRLTVQVSSRLDAGGVLERHGFVRGAVRQVLGAPPRRAGATDPPTDIPLEQIGPDIWRHFAHVVCAGYGLPEDSALPRWFDDVMGQRSVTSYAAFDGWSIVGVAAMFVDRGVASLRGASTLVGARGRGIHEGLVLRRLEDAAALGVRHVLAEVRGADEGSSRAAVRTLRRLGFTALHERQDWVWEAPERGVEGLTEPA